jgi:hypothetical protein
VRSAEPESRRKCGRPWDLKDAARDARCAGIL